MKTVADYPAYKVVDLESDLIDITSEISQTLKFCVAYESRRHGVMYSEVSVSCVDYYTRQKGGDDAQVLEAVDREKQRGHALFWISNVGTCLTAHKRDKVLWNLLRDGQKVRMAGKELVVKKLRHGDIYYKLEPVK